MGDPNSPTPEWAKALGPDFLKFLEETDFLEFLEETNTVAAQPVPEPDFLKIFDLFLEETKEVSAAHTVAEQPDKRPQQILTEMGVTSVSAEPPRENTAIAVPAKGTNRTKTTPPMATECSAGKSESHLHKSSTLPGLPSRSTDSSASDQLSCEPKKRVNTLVGSGVRMNRPGNMAAPQQGNYAPKKRPQRPRRTLGVRQAFISVAITCLIIGVSWRAGQDRAVGPARLSSTMTQAPAASNSDFASEPSPKPTPVSNLAQAATLSVTAPANSKIAARILFAFDSSELDSESEKTLRGTLEQISTAKNPAIEIHGYSDSVGAAAYNQFLSEERARAVRNYLLRFGMLEDVQIKIVGHGSDAPVAPDSNADGFVSPGRRKTNRRVEVILYDSSGNASGN